MMRATFASYCPSALALFAAAVFVAPCGAQESQEPRPILSVLAGPSPYDLSGTGTGFAVGAWVSCPVWPFLLLEGGSGYFRYTAQGGSAVAYLLPEVGFRAGVPAGPWFPYAGGGVGLASVVSGFEGTDLTLHVVLGVRLWITSGIGARVEGRLRSVDPWSGNMTDVTGGLVIRL
jgi:hypothetical protein